MSLSFKLIFDRYIGWVLIVVLNLAARFLGAVLKRDHALSVKGDILVIKMLGGGSLIQAMPSLLGVRRTYPDVKMRLFTTNAVKPFAQTMGVFDEIIVLNDKNLAHFLLSGWRCLFSFMGHDTVIDLEIYSYLSTVLSLFTCARNRIGFFYEETGFRQILHTHKIFFHPGSPLYAHYDRIANLLGAPVATTASCAALIRKTIGGTDIKVQHKVAIGCGCSGLSNERKLDPDQWARHVFARSPDKSREAVFFGAKTDYMESEKVIATVRALGAVGWQGPFTNRCGATPLALSLKELLACEEYWGIESSLLQYARLFGLKCKMFLGPTHPMRFRPIDGLSEEVFYRKTICSPCIHLVSGPPCHGRNLCMKWLFEEPQDGVYNEMWIPVVTQVQGKRASLADKCLPREVD